MRLAAGKINDASRATRLVIRAPSDTCTIALWRSSTDTIVRRAEWADIVMIEVLQ